MEGSEDMVEEVFDICAKVLKIPMRGTRQVGSVHGLPTVSDTFLNKPSREHQCRTFNQMQRAQMLDKASLWFRSAPSQVLRGSQPQIPIEHMRPVVGYGTTKQAVPRFPVKPAIVEWPVGVADKTGIDGCPACKERVAHGTGITYDEPGRTLHRTRIASCDFFMTHVRIEIFRDSFPEPVNVNVDKERVPLGLDTRKRHREQIGECGPGEPVGAHRRLYEGKAKWQDRLYASIEHTRLRLRRLQ